MIVRKLTSDSLRTMKLFGSICGSEPLDCFDVEESIIFITASGQTGKAIGKNGTNIKRLRNTLNKDIKIIENADSVNGLIENYLFPIKTKSIEEEDSVVKIKLSSGKERRLLLSNNQKELKKLKKTISRYHPRIKDILILKSLAEDKVYKGQYQEEFNSTEELSDPQE